MEIDDARIAFRTLQLLHFVVAFWDVEVQLELARERRNGGVDGSMEVWRRRQGSREFVQHHADAHEEPPYFGLDVEQPSWATKPLWRRFGGHGNGRQGVVNSRGRVYGGAMYLRKLAIRRAGKGAVDNDNDNGAMQSSAWRATPVATFDA